MREIVISLCLAAGCAVGAAGPADAAWTGVHGFAETAAGVRTDDSIDTKHSDYHFLEQRLQFKTQYFWEGENFLAEKNAVVNLKADGTVDGYFGAKTAVEVREANLSFSPLERMDVRAGRQVLTWGTGDYLFVNDLFPKDYISFFSGRDDEYLKRPSDAVRVSLFHEAANLDIVAAAFQPNLQPDGDRLSFYDLFEGEIAGCASDRRLVEPARQLSNAEYALRLYRGVGSHEAALYAFRGFDKNASSIKDEAAHELFYRRLDVYGGSLRGPAFGGIGNLEAGYYNSREDDAGDNRLIENSMVKTLAGYERDLGGDWRVGVQYLYEHRLDYGAYEDNLLSSDLRYDQGRHLLTQRVTKLYKNQTVAVSVFHFYSPSDEDGYLRPSIQYDVTDRWKVTLGANVPWGEGQTTEFAQMKKNKNIYLRARYSF